MVVKIGYRILVYDDVDGAEICFFAVPPNLLCCRESLKRVVYCVPHKKQRKGLEKRYGAFEKKRDQKVRIAFDSFSLSVPLIIGEVR